LSEDTRQFLERKQSELTSKLEALLDEAQKINNELQGVRRALAAFDAPPRSARNALAGGIAPATTALSGGGIISGLGALSNFGGGGVSPLTEPRGLADVLFGGTPPAAAVPAEDITIKGLVTSAFRTCDDFLNNGASTADLKEYIRVSFDRDIDRASLSPTLSRMRSDGVLRGPDDEGRWHYAGSRR
jgi:hypothetical protein